MRQRLALCWRTTSTCLPTTCPLDAHPELGNAQLGLRLGLQTTGRFGEQDLGWIGVPAPAPGAADGVVFASAQALASHVQAALAHPGSAGAGPNGCHSPWAGARAVRKSYFEAAIAAGVDAFITGEISEPQAHYARERGVALFGLRPPCDRALWRTRLWFVRRRSWVLRTNLLISITPPEPSAPKPP